MALSELTPDAILKAIQEFDDIGRGAFLKKHGFGKARGYMLLHNGKPYDSKAIVGVAHGYLAEHSVMGASEFSGGEARVQTILEKLQFNVIGPDDAALPTPGEILTNEEISYRFAVGNMGGMRRSTKYNLLVLISDPFKGLYQDRWEGREIHYTGMGPTDEQSISYAQNKTLSESVSTKIPVHLVEALSPQKYTYVGLVELVGPPYQEEQPDDTGKNRNVWMFPLRTSSDALIPKLSKEQARTIEESQSRLAHRLSIEELKRRAQAAKATPAVRAVSASAYARDAAVAEYAKRLANGLCDLCEMQAPFRNRENQPYLECHHVVWLAQGGKDTIANTVALCPNCHCKMHIVNLHEDQKTLIEKASTRALL